MSTVEPSLAGPKRPQDRVSLRQAKVKFEQALEVMLTERKAEGGARAGGGHARRLPRPSPPRLPCRPGSRGSLTASVVVAAITSCTNTSNPSVMIGAGLLARNAVKRGLKTKPWVKTSLAPGSLIVTEYYKAAGLLEYLAELGFNIVGYGCTTCIGNSGPLPEPVSKIVKDQNLVVASVLSGNRNFEGRIQSQVRANYLASPPLVVAYALAGKMQIDLTSEPLGQDAQGQPVYLKDIWPTEREIQETMLKAVRSEMFRDKYAHVFDGDERWRSLPVPDRRAFRMVGRLHLHPQPAVLRASDARAGAAGRHPRRASARGARRQRHDRSHLAGRIDSGGQPGGEVSDLEGRDAGRLQLVRRASRQSRSHDARHVRQYPAAQPARAGNRGRLDDAPARRAK